MKWWIDPKIPRVVIGDPARFTQVLVNLAGNAIKFTETGSVTIVVKRVFESEDELEIECGVCDTGIGVPEHKKKTIFEAFEQADGTITRSYGGLGLGLPLAARLVKMMGGNIRLQSAPKNGTEVSFTVRMHLPGSVAAGIRRTPAPITIPRNWAAFQRHLAEGRSAAVGIISDAGRTQLSGRIWSASEGFIRVVVKEPVQTGMTVQVKFDEDHCANGEIVFCQQWPDDFNLGIQILASGRIRREPRFPVALRGELTVLGDFGPSAAAIDIVDISGSGLGIVCGEALELGSCIQIKSEAGIIFGEVRYCYRDETGTFRGGIKMYQLIEHAGGAAAVGVRQWWRRMLQRGVAH